MGCEVFYFHLDTLAGFLPDSDCREAGFGIGRENFTRRGSLLVSGTVIKKLIHRETKKESIP